jgi:hypothetical protein
MLKKLRASCFLGPSKGWRLPLADAINCNIDAAQERNLQMPSSL